MITAPGRRIPDTGLRRGKPRLAIGLLALAAVLAARPAAPAAPVATAAEAAPVATAAEAAPARPIPPERLRSGLDFAAPGIRALQADDFANPGMLWVERGERLWGESAGAAAVSCASCHGKAADAMKGVAARYPRIDPESGALRDLPAQINACRVRRQQAPAWAAETEPLLAMTVYVATQSRGMPLSVSIDGPARPHFEAGRAIYERRMGQMNLACLNCHGERWGGRLLAETISQGHGTAYPIYRLDWQTVGSLERRFRSCLSGIRAEMWPYGSSEVIDLELYLAWRAQGLPIETPGVRK